VSRERSTIVTAIADLFLLSVAYLLAIGLTMLARPASFPWLQALTS
jgi:hypothetical protein